MNSGKANERNEALIAAFVAAIEEKYSEDIDLAVVSGSYARGDHHENSDLDITIIPRTERGRELGRCFILDGIGYDFYAVSWDNLERLARLDIPFPGKLLDGRLIYATGEARERFGKLKDQAIEALRRPFDGAWLKLAQGQMDKALADLGAIQLTEDMGSVREYAGGVLVYGMNVIYLLNARGILVGDRGRFADFMSLPELPEAFDKHYRAIVEAETVEALADGAKAFIRSLDAMLEEKRRHTEPPVAAREGLVGTYEEAVSNWHHKIRIACEGGDAPGAFLSTVMLQNFYDWMHRRFGLAHIDLISRFDARRLDSFWAAYQQAQAVHRAQYEENGVQPLVYESVEDFKDDLLSAKA